ncbi:uncharacterized protein BX664DRAFT_336110 [Halteromyces radiatus]|uniref:uncharacterized protein n=1 Tax=Halteromyces radiatus TaxID=101107 RepID=UPI0022208516|nr:uncharacterized protein BX664DRAFT_336110 [Halteromyces radiatus]KAI8086540.1 hypothetical protein BX664DRAFT_336110 [Halteromyces radiatus]
MPESLTRKNHLSRRGRISMLPNLSIVIPPIQENDHQDDASYNDTVASSPTLSSSCNTLSGEYEHDYFTSSSSSSPATPLTSNVFSNFYLKLPNGKWRVRCRTGDRKIIGTYEVDGSMI